MKQENKSLKDGFLPVQTSCGSHSRWTNISLVEMAKCVNFIFLEMDNYLEESNLSIQFQKAKSKHLIYTHNILDTVRLQKEEREPMWTK